MAAWEENAYEAVKDIDNGALARKPRRGAASGGSGATARLKRLRESLDPVCIRADHCPPPFP